MALESATYVKDLIATNPLFDDPKSQGDDHIRLIKSVLSITFANIGGVVGLTVTPAALHTWSGTQDFSGATVSVLTQATSSNSSSPASTAFVHSLFTATPVSLGWRSRMLFLGAQ